MIGIRNEIFTAPNPNLIAGDFGEWSGFVKFDNTFRGSTAGHPNFEFHYCQSGIEAGERITMHMLLECENIERNSGTYDDYLFGVQRGDLRTDSNIRIYRDINMFGLRGEESFPANGVFEGLYSFMTDRPYRDMSFFFVWYNLKGRFRFRRLKVERGSWSPYVMGGA